MESDITSGTPLIVDTRFEDFEEYIASLSKSARENWAYVKKHNTDLVYGEVGYKKHIVEQFMEIWSKQTIHGNEPVRWAFDIQHVNHLNERGVLRVFEAKLDDEVIACQFVEDHDGYVECHPPMYDKGHNPRYLAKFMWFNLIRFAIENELGFIDLGSGDRGTWKELVKNRHRYPRIAYKWMYVPKKIKDNPDNEPDYLVYEQYGAKWISESDTTHS